MCNAIYYFLENTQKNSWKNLRDVFSKCVIKKEHLTRSRAGLPSLPQCKYCKELAFLSDAVTNRLPESNLNMPQFHAVDNGEWGSYAKCQATGTH